MFLRDQKVLFLKGAFEFELTLANSIDVRANARQGLITIPERAHYGTRASLLARYAITNRLEINLLLPYQYQVVDYDYAFLEPVAVLDDESQAGLDDLHAGLRFQLLQEGSRHPGVAIALDYSSDTGDKAIGKGFDSVSIRSTFVKSIDPVVIFAETAFEFNRERKDFKAGNGWQISFGTGFSLNDRVSYNVQYSAGGSDADEIGGVAIPNSRRRLGSLQLGMTVQLSRRVFLEPFIGIGLTADATDVSAGLGIPF